MSAPKITLRPPPNVEFVQGYPGIPPAAPDRPLAGVKGTLEVRVGAQGVKAKWVRVELRKVETLPGGGQQNTFFDFIGPSPINVWAADEREEWKELQTQDFPFFIRIPESIPPSIALERNAGIKYELIATICLKGKKGLFRRSKTPILSTSTPIVIDKHELHSTWPIYSQPDSRHVVTDALTLTVDRTHTCYGPGDRVSVIITIRNDNITTVTVRALEFMLKETIIFRTGAHASGKKAAPQVRTSVIGEHKVPVNLTLYGGTQHRAELATMVPQGHTTTTVTAARHIDITYSIVVNAVFPAGKPLLMELPVTISNWPRGMSVEAVKRIGPTPNLSLLTPHQLHMHTQSSVPPNALAQTTASSTMSPNEKKRPGSSGGANSGIPQNLVPGGGQASGQSHLRTNASHQMRPYSIAERVAQHATEKPTSSLNNTMPMSYSSPNAVVSSPINRRGYDEFGYTQGGASSTPQVTTVHGYPGRANQTTTNNPSEPTRQRSANAVNPASRLTVANVAPDGEDSDRGTHTAVSSAPTPANRYPTAAEEKKRLQQQLNMQASPASSGSSSAVPVRPSSPPRQTSLAQRTQWPTAEEEKARLYERARAQVESNQARLQGHSSSPSSSVDHGASSSASYGGVPQARWETAEEEKTRLFEQARRAVEETHARAAEEENIRLLQSDNEGYGYSPMSPRGAALSNITPSYMGPSMSSSTMSSSTATYTPIRRPDATSSVGAQLYSSAMASVSRPTPPQTQTVQKPPPPPSSSPTNPPMALSSAPVAGKSRAAGSPQQSQRTVYPSAEEEKAALRYYEAKLAVERAQNEGGFVQGSSSTQEPVPDEPIAYDALYPSKPAAVGGSSFATNGYNSTAETSIPTYQPPPQPFNSALTEKERLRRKYEEEEAAAANKTPSPPPIPTALPPPSSAVASSPSPPLYGTPASQNRPARSQPLPPVAAGGSRHLSAAEEKARLRVQYEAEEAAANPNQAGPSGAGSSNYTQPAQYDSAYDSPPYADPMSPQVQVPASPRANLARTPSYATSTQQVSSIPPPPPLMPKPPARYIQETQEVDARVQGDDDMYVSDEDAEIPAVGNSLQIPDRSHSPLDLVGDYTGDNAGAGNAVPPRPPKVPA